MNKSTQTILLLLLLSFLTAKWVWIEEEPSEEATTQQFNVLPTISDEVLQTYVKLKVDHKYKYLIFRITEDPKQVSVTTMGQNSESYDNLLNNLSPNECAFAVFDADYKAADGDAANKAVFILWTPDDANVRSKLLYTSTKETLRRKLGGVGLDISATEKSDIAWEKVLAKLRKLR